MRVDLILEANNSGARLAELGRLAESYGFGGLWGIVGERGGAHGLDERVYADGFHDQIPLWMDMLKRLAG